MAGRGVEDQHLGGVGAGLGGAGQVQAHALRLVGRTADGVDPVRPGDDDPAGGEQIGLDPDLLRRPRRVDLEAHYDRFTRRVARAIGGDGAAGGAALAAAVDEQLGLLELDTPLV